MFNKSLLIFLWMTVLFGCSLAIHLNLEKLFGAKNLDKERDLRGDQIEFETFTNKFNRVYLNQTGKHLSSFSIVNFFLD